MYVDEVLAGFMTLIFLNDIQQFEINNPIFLLILRSLKLEKQLVTNKYAKVAVQSTAT